MKRLHPLLKSVGAGRRQGVDAAGVRRGSPGKHRPYTPVGEARHQADALQQHVVMVVVRDRVRWYFMFIRGIRFSRIDNCCSE